MINASPSAERSIVAISATTSAAPRSFVLDDATSTAESEVMCIYLPSEIQIPRRDLEGDLLVGDVTLPTSRRPCLKEERARRSAKRLGADLHAQRDAHFADTKKIGVETIAH